MYVTCCVHCCNLLCALRLRKRSSDGDSDHDDNEGGGQCGVAAHHHLISSHHTHTLCLRAVTVCGHVVLAFTVVPHERFWPTWSSVDHIGFGY
ncbi:hypothetical protein WUBG_05391 [Wuchereria bancrofti]|uniref:Uncharacterized protein n=1 Tax=Wuchereria bancrofti TaxID=6293 RepID=J9F8M0_WUCBA|nr:hypothetical protein WUBG_05391 [Wuchereria bancrofti]